MPTTRTRHTPTRHTPITRHTLPETQPTQLITITDQETKHLTQHERLTLVQTHLLLKNFNLTKTIQYDYNPKTKTTTITQ